MFSGLVVVLVLDVVGDDGFEDTFDVIDSSEFFVYPFILVCEGLVLAELFGFSAESIFQGFLTFWCGNSAHEYGELVV